MKNHYEIQGDTTILLLSKRDGTTIRALIDTNDLSIADSNPGTWYEQKSGSKSYVRGADWNSGNQKGFYLHRILLSCPDSLVVDHINHNGLDNRRSNLRIVTPRFNNLHRRGLPSNNTSGVRGVFWDAKAGKWRACLHQHGRKIYLGCFDDLAEAEAVIESKRQLLLAQLLRKEHRLLGGVE